jgi:hypothetical protein
MVSMWSVNVWPKMSLEEGGRVLGVVVVVILTNEDCVFMRQITVLATAMVRLDVAAGVDPSGAQSIG